MKLDEIRERAEALRAQNEKLAEEMKKGDVESAIAASAAAVISGGFWLGEIALQLAELNTHLHNGIIVERGSGGGPPS